MKRIITIILSVMLAITASAQTKTLLDNILEAVNETCDYNVIYHLDKPNRICTDQYDYISFDINHEDIFLHRNSPHNDSISRKQVLLNNHFRNSLDSLMKIAEESYHYETHYKGEADTIMYSICLSNIDGGVKRRINNHGQVVYPDAIESISYDFNSGHYKADSYYQKKDTILEGVKTPIYTKIEQKIDTIIGGRGSFRYTKAELIDEIRPFNKEQYYQIIQPVLKQKGIKSWKFKWEINDDYEYNPKEYTHGYYSIGGPGVTSGPGAGTREGTVYFIPKKNKELGEKILSAIDSLTFNYINNNLEQDFYYRSNQHNEAKSGLDPNAWIELRHILSAHFDIDNGDRVEVLVGCTEAGYYIVVSENNGTNGFPTEWYRLKSFNNGKKEYIKGSKELNKREVIIIGEIILEGNGKLMSEMGISFFCRKYALDSSL